MSPLIRPAERRDADVIAAFTTDTFSWGDYVGEAFLDWLDEPATQVAVAADSDDRPVAIARVRMLSDREGWLSAARVHPDHRRRGLGSALNDWCVGWVESRGGAVVRLQIEEWNDAAINQVEGLGYRPVATVVNADRAVADTGIEPATNGGRRKRAEERLDRAPRAEAEGAFIAWSTSELARAAHGLYPVEPWAWRRMIQDDARRGQTWFCPSGWVMAEQGDERLVVRWMVATPEDAGQLVRATVDLAQERGSPGVHLVVPSLEWMADALSHNGFQSHPSLIFEKPL
ncbi:MAG: N-acetyltransferase family protein [Actinomycetota bacterium]